MADPLARAGGVAGEHLGLEQRLEELLVGPGLGAGPLGGRLYALEHARRLQLLKQVGQPLTGLRLRRAHAHSSAWRARGGVEAVVPAQVQEAWIPDGLLALTAGKAARRLS